MIQPNIIFNSHLQGCW